MLRDILTGVLSTRVLRPVGTMVHRHVSRTDRHGQSHSTWFMRNPPLLEALARVVADRPAGSRVRVCSVACSTGAELYSTLFALRSARPDLHVAGVGIDVSSGVVDACRAAVYRTSEAAASGVGLFNPGPSELAVGMTTAGGDWPSRVFEAPADGVYHVREWLRRDTEWLVADAGDPSLRDRLGPQDIVLANNFLGPMADDDAERCLRNVAGLVRPGGHLVVDGVDLEVKTRVLRSLGAVAVLERFEEIYRADPTKQNWPWTRWAHEPIDRSRDDWQLRYGVLFVLGRNGRDARSGAPSY